MEMDTVNLSPDDTKQSRAFQLYFLLLIQFLPSQMFPTAAGAPPDQRIQQMYLDLFSVSSQAPLTDMEEFDLTAEPYVLPEKFSEFCSRESFYYSFNPECQENVEIIVQLLLREKNTTRLLQLAKRLRDDPTIHPKVWYTALSRVTLHREDLMGLWKPLPYIVNPGDFIDARAIAEAIGEDQGDDGYQSARTVRTIPDKRCVVLDETFANSGETEQKLWYFREDLQVNSFHWFWHAIYPPLPCNSTRLYDPPALHGDRRGELFYYMHHYVVARYNADRLSNNLSLTIPFELRNGYIMQESYVPNLDDCNTGVAWSGRTKPTTLPESVIVPGKNQCGQLLHTYLNRTIEKTNRIIQSIDEGFFETRLGRISLRNFTGIDWLGENVDISIFSVDSNYYGSLHRSGHLLIALATNPTDPSAIPGVMAEAGTSLRDPIFYKWHRMIDIMFDRHKKTLEPYRPTGGEFPLLFPNVIIEDVMVYNSNSIQPNPDDSSATTLNKLKTFWSYKNLTLSSGLGFDRNKQLPHVQLCIKHLNHEPFTYNIKIRTKGAQLATIRIFLAPRYDPNGLRFNMEQQRTMFFVLDTFTTQLKNGLNVIKRESTKSTLTIPTGEGIYNIEQTDRDRRPDCGCGWPMHLLLPKGTVEGMVYDIFIMATNGQEDKTTYMASTESNCHSAPLICGLAHKKYPDTKPMGYPFDRVPFTLVERHQQGESFKNINRTIANLDEYVRFVPNSFTTQIIIKHEDRIR